MEKNILANEIIVFEENYSYEKKENGFEKFDSPTESNSHTLKFLAFGPSFDIVSKALEEATYINHITGEPFIRTSVLYKTIFTEAVIQIDFIEDENLQTIQVKSLDINDINYNLIKIVAKKWIKEVL